MPLSGFARRETFQDCKKSTDQAQGDTGEMRQSRCVRNRAWRARCTSKQADGATRAAVDRRDVMAIEETRRDRRPQHVRARRPGRRAADSWARRYAGGAALHRTRLARAGYTVYCCQLAGHCGTPEELRRSTWHEWYASVEAAHDKLKEHCDVILAGGLSMGGILALHLAQNRPDGRAGPAAVRADPEARRLVDALALGGPAVCAAAAGAARVGSRRARSLRHQGRARAPAGGVEHAERRYRRCGHLQHAAALVRPFQLAGRGGEAATSARCASRPSSCIRATTTWRA